MNDMQITTQNLGVGITNADSYALSKRIAADLAASNLIPQQFQGNAPNCMIALNMATRIGADPLMVMQNLYIVHGKPGWSSQFLIATFNSNPKFSALRYEFKGEESKDGWGCRAWAVEHETGENLYGSWVTLKLAKDEGWYAKSGSKWKTMPQQMLMYRAAAFFIRTFAPEVAMGLQTAEEVKDTTYQTQPQAETKDLDEKIMEMETAEPPQFFCTEEESATVLGGKTQEYLAADAVRRGHLIVEMTAPLGGTESDMERLVCKSRSQWTKKDRLKLLETFSLLVNGEPPQDVFPLV